MNDSDVLDSMQKVRRAVERNGPIQPTAAATLLMHNIYLILKLKPSERAKELELLAPVLLSFNDEVSRALLELFTTLAEESESEKGKGG